MPAKRQPTTNLEAAQSGDRRAALVALRDTLAERLDSTETQVHAQLAAQYRATLAELAELDGMKAPTPKGVADDLKARREAKGRRPTTDASANA